MNEQLAAIKARRDAITPGVWEADGLNICSRWSDSLGDDDSTICEMGGSDADAAFIAAAPGDIDTLLAMVEQRDARIDALMAMWQANTDALAALTAERDALREQLQQAQRELAGGKPEPTQQENDAAQERLHQMDALYMRHGSNTRTWPDYALSAYTRLMAAQTEYEAKYC